jgi:ABC-type iron transport system FetAB ATPase subunit
MGIEICDLRIGSKEPILMKINIKVAAGSLKVVSEPTGSGKSALLRAILSEIAIFQHFNHSIKEANRV